MGTFKKYKIDEELYKGHKGEYIVTNVLNELYDNLQQNVFVTRVPNDKDIQQSGIDAYVNEIDENDNLIPFASIEIKTDFSTKYQSLFVEEHSDFDSGKKEIGYLWGSKADYLCYYFAYQHKLYILKFEDFRAHMTQKLKSKNPYILNHKRKEEKTETTYYYIVPLADIQDIIYKIDVNYDFDQVEYNEGD